MKLFRLVGACLALLLPTLCFGQAISSPTPFAKSFVQFWVSQSATGTATSAAVTVPNFSGAGTLVIIGSGITGSPSGCTIALAWQSVSSSTSSAAQQTISFTPGNSFQFEAVTLTNLSGDRLVATYACATTYPSAGTISVSYSPFEPLWVVGSSLSNQTVNITQLGGAAISATTAGIPDYNIKNIGNAAYSLGSTTMANSAPTVQATNQGNPCFNPNSTPTTLTGASSGTSATQIIALSAGKQIFLCSVVLTTISGTSPTYKLEYGTGTNCATLVGTLVGPSATSSAGSIFNYPNAFIVPASDELCYLMGGTTPVYNYAIVYVQQ